MKRKNVKPFYVILEPGISQSQSDGAIEGIRATLQIAQVLADTDVVIIERKISFKGIAYSSIMEWFLKRGRETSTNNGYLNASTILDCLKENPLQEKRPHYCAVVVKQPLYVTKEDGTFHDTCSGVASPGYGFVMSVYESRGSNARVTEKEFCLLLSNHETGHVCNVRCDRHCKNACNMVFTWEETFAALDAIRKKLFCDECSDALINNFPADDESVG